MNRTLGKTRESDLHHCSVCGPDPPPKRGEPVLICDDCANPDTINLYCACCGRRVEFTFEDGCEFITRFQLLSEPPKQPGLVIRFDPCSRCAANAQEIIKGYRVFYINRELEARHQEDYSGIFH